MLHLIKDKGGFDNYSFRFRAPSEEACQEARMNKWNISRVHLKKDFVSYKKIRLGEFEEGGNLWVQVLEIERLLENRLLRYEGELE
jgi:hypothetical protein